MCITWSAWERSLVRVRVSKVNSKNRSTIAHSKLGFNEPLVWVTDSYCQTAQGFPVYQASS